MIRLFGYILGTISGGACLGSTFALIYQIFILEQKRHSDFGENLSLILLIDIFSIVLFFYVYNTGFGKSKLEKAKDELEILKIKKEIKDIEI